MEDITKLLEKLIKKFEFHEEYENLSYQDTIKFFLECILSITFITVKLARKVNELEKEMEKSNEKK